jgi:hypothetical protein
VSDEVSWVEGDSPPARRRKGWVVPVLSGALVLALAAAVTFGILLVRGTETSPEDVGDFMATESAEVDERATQVIDLLLNYDATTIESVADEMLTVSTGNFRQQYEELIVGGAEGGLAEALQAAAASSRGQFLEGPDISFTSPSEAVAIARVTQTTQSSDNPTGRTIEYVLQLTLVNTTDEGWKADRVEVLTQREV